MNKTIYCIGLIILLVSCKSKTETEIMPILSIDNYSDTRSATQSTTFRFYVNVSPVSAKNITVQYKTNELTATANKDFAPITGTLSIPANSKEAYIEVIVSKDSLIQADQTFEVELSLPTNAVLAPLAKAIGTIHNNGTYLPIDATGYVAANSYAGMSLAWSDEFNGKTINTAYWTHETGGGGWGNNELQNYTNSTNNSFMSSGCLVLEARRETVGNNNYTSARIISKDKKTFTYGRVDIRAKLPKGQGIWPALWMLGNNISTNWWPACGEIDIMELLGHQPNKTYATIHWGNAGGGSTHIGNNYSLSTESFNDKFHVFSMKWEVDKMMFYVDDVLIFTAQKSQVTGNYPFDKPFFFIMNIAVGGNWPGNPDGNTTFPQRMMVDYVRVYQ